MVLVGNKMDLMEDLNIEELKEEHDIFDLEIFYTSAKTGQNIEKPFEYLAHQIFEEQN